MAVATPASTQTLPAPRFRLRYVLLIAFVVWGMWWIVPRAQAAWQVHALAVTAADYALCMVGPTGPGLLRTNSDEFARLVRRRVLASPPNEAPFAKCTKGARELSGSVEVELKHAELAKNFAEYAGTNSATRIADLRVGISKLAELARDAWPFVRSGITPLMKPSLGAKEAVHPVAPAKPSLGRGLPGFRAHYRAVTKAGDALLLASGRGAHLSGHRSTDGGVTWRATSPRGSTFEEIAGRCPAGSGKSFTLSVSDDGNFLTVNSHGPDDALHVSELVPESDIVISAACDERALVAFVRSRAKRGIQLYRCPFAGRCHVMAMPTFGEQAFAEDGIDVARVHGTTVVALKTGGIVRVASSRDEGRSWTPFAVAFDEAEHPELRSDVRVPSRLLTIENRVLLYGAASKSAQSYPVLISDDHGASFRSLL